MQFPRILRKISVATHLVFKDNPAPQGIGLILEHLQERPSTRNGYPPYRKVSSAHWNIGFEAFVACMMFMVMGMLWGSSALDNDLATEYEKKTGETW